MPNFPLQNGIWCGLNFPCQKHWVSSSGALLVQKTLFPCIHSFITSGFHTLSAPCSWPLSLGRRGCDTDSHLQLSIVVSCTLYLDQLGVSVLINIYCKCQHVWWELTDAWIYWFDDSSLEVSLVAFPFSRIMVVVRTIWPHQSPDWSLRLI